MHIQTCVIIGDETECTVIRQQNFFEIFHWQLRDLHDLHDQLEPDAKSAKETSHPHAKFLIVWLENTHKKPLQINEKTYEKIV